MFLTPSTAAPGVMSLEYAIEGILDEEVRRRTSSSLSSHSNVLVTKNRGKN